MAVIVFNDGKRGKATYEQAATIFQILEGNEAIIDRATKEQLEYAKTVTEVIFDEPKKAANKPTGKGELRKAVDDIMPTSFMTGHQKFLAIKKRMQGE